MTQEPLPDSVTADGELRHLLNAGKPTIRILLYTDDPFGITDNDEVLGLGTMKRHLKAHAPAFANLLVEWVSRYSKTTMRAENKLDALLKQRCKGYDQVWFFGTHQASRTKFTSGLVSGGPDSELIHTELEVLREWMSVGEGHKIGGGVLMTGDHSQKLLTGTFPGKNPLCPDLHTDEKYLGIGRALGRCVPRAGRLRTWEGEPTNRPEDSLNTQAPVPGSDIESQSLQLDPLPQQLFLLRFDEKGNPSRRGKPHPLFSYKNGNWIQFFPDHAHEGAIVVPNDDEFANVHEWPTSKYVQPRPRVVARGLDHRTCSLIDLIAAYNGDCVGVGRIVADSTWHHYVSVNLTSLPHPSEVGTPADHIGQFYGNLALWLTPRRRRREMARVMFCRLANHPLMFEEVGGDLLNIGRTAYAALMHEASPCEIQELLDAAVPDAYREMYETIYFPEAGTVLSPFPSKILVLACIVNSYHEEMILTNKTCAEIDEQRADELIDSGFRDALSEHQRLLEMVSADTLTSILNNHKKGDA